MQAEIARIKAEAAAEVAAAQGRAAASAAAGDASAVDASTADVAGQKAQLERTVAELTATLSARQKEFDALLRCDGQAAQPRIAQDCAAELSCRTTHMVKPVWLFHNPISSCPAGS